MKPYQKDLQEIEIPRLDSLRNSNILVTGATGLVGSTLAELLLLHAKEYSYTVYAGCRSKEKFEKRFGTDVPNIIFFELDVTKSLQSCEHFDYIVHAASGASPNAFASDPVGVMKANLFGTTNLLDYGIEHGLKRFLYISSGEAYGEGCIGKWTEKDSGYVDSMSPRACYPSSKRAAETLCAAYAKQFNVETVVARLCHTYGPCFTDSDNRVYAQFIRNIIHGEDIVLKSKGEQYRSWLYVVDCVSALLYILINGESGEAYNVANDDSNITIKQLAEIVAKIAGKKVVFDLPSEIEKQSGTPIKKSVFDTTKIENLGWHTQTDIKKGLMNTIETLQMSRAQKQEADECI